jgi:hypothetical protein
LRLPFESSPHDEAEEESRHDNVPQAEHGEMTDVLVGGEDELAGQGEAGRAARHPAAHRQLARHHAHGVFGGARSDAHHHVGAEYVLETKELFILRSRILNFFCYKRDLKAMVKKRMGFRRVKTSDTVFISGKR